MNLLTAIDPVAGLREANEYLGEASITKIVSLARGGRVPDISQVKAITNDEGKLLAYADVEKLVPWSSFSPDIQEKLKVLLSSATNQQSIDAQPNVSQNIHGQRLVR